MKDKKDASTQTEPVIITEIDEEDVPQEGIFISKRTAGVNLDVVPGDEASRKRFKTGDISKALVGKENVEQEQFEIEQEQIKQDLSFYDRCEAYVSTIYQDKAETSFFYSIIKDTLKYPIISKIPGFNVEKFTSLTKDLFLNNASGDYYTKEENKIRLTLQVAGIYKVCVDTPEIQQFFQDDQETQLTDRGLLKSTLQECLECVTDTELAGQIFDILDITR